ncbi:MAG: hypothetical protein AAFZ17_23015 [Cyanobacteria bacterium J06650_10]
MTTASLQQINSDRSSVFLGSTGMSSRTSKSKLRDRIVTVRFTTAEYRQVVNEATAVGQQRPAVYCRQRLLSRSRARPVSFSPTMLSEVRSLRMTLGQLGNTINQIAHRLNQGDAASPALVKDTCKLLEAVRTEVRDFHTALK